MNRIISLFAGAALLLLLTTGCIETHLLVKVHADGSGTMKETVKMNSEVLLPILEMAKAMNMQQEGEDGAAADPPPPPAPELFSEQQIRDRAASHGLGVTYLSHEVTDDGAKRGYVAEYGFSDIGALRLDSDPGAALPEFPGETTEEGSVEEDYVLFTFTKGSPARLVVRPPAMDSKNDADNDVQEEGVEQGADAQGSGESEVATEEMKRIFQDMRMSIRVETDGDIVRSNATYREGNVITVLDIDFSVLLDNEETVKRLNAMDGMDPAQMKDIIASIPGLKFDTAKEIEILFK